MMTNVCSGCGREIEKNFVYCPWCGIQLIRKESREYQNLFFEQVERKRRTEQEQKLQNVGKQLDELEKELDVLVLCAELAR
ncbi:MULTISPECIES: zinc-ribbon domain-containing protein [Treponema]|uniref:Zinc-ribbon domain-containing protein n=1 Tax=Treponema porcinum TaxID=261392 RepID=A0A1T4JNL9_TREPO|nr:MULTISPECIES: zinc-ribbon domain-containing protein [Treponema]MCI5644181.1 zinc-ribbon domain-containing protein [Treponema porcinum]MCI6481443.1 zinc-ribbon domain-containing protein [Treponema porcinum]MDD6899613.1 zinc-ribbon domain-containing protein [Treponema porcinum]MDD7125349.1 zinc-ribbon domain-containing protein [Treponema porcinum]MDY4468237.1 zinc-ribbon domain-containing protein [Treponema porcinum]